jgi:hopanoid-associated phosphorylase
VPNRRIVVATGLAREASIARGEGVRCVAAGGNAARLVGLLEREIARGADALMSFGIAGALIDGVAAGTCIVAPAVIARDARIAAHSDWTSNLARCLPDALVGEVAGQDTIAATPQDKRALHARTRAAAVDNESHVVAELARVHGIPFAVLRVVSDPVHRGLPDAARIGLTPDGAPDVGAVLRALVARPQDIVPLARTGVDAARALRALSAARRRLGPGLGYPDLRELLVDVA